MLDQLARYVIAGVALNAGLYLVYLLLTLIGLAPLIASSAAFVLGVPLSLVTHGRFTFRAGRISQTRKSLFGLGYLTGYLTQIGTLAVLHHRLGLPHEISQVIAIATVAAVLFVFQKLMIFQA